MKVREIIFKDGSKVRSDKTQSLHYSLGWINLFKDNRRIESYNTRYIVIVKWS